MSITYLRNRAREMRNARTEAEYEEILEKLARHLITVPTGRPLTPVQKQEVFLQLRKMGIIVPTYHE
ncbi:MAG: hypothetical protein GPI95_24625 [Microcystis aeruginosa LG13-11]|jgi:hypothetical protein|nr:hypothetical protein [Microcystis aeruginosa LG13-11]